MPLTIDNPPRKESLWIPRRSNSNEIETFISLVEKDLFQDTSRKRIPSNLSEDEKKALKDWRKNVLFNKESDKVMRLQDKGNRFIIVDKQTDHEKADEQIERSSFLKIDYDSIQWNSNRRTKLFCSYADLAVFNIDKNVLQAKRNTYQELRYFGRYRDDCLALWTGSLEKLELFLMFLNSLDSNLQFTVEIGGSELCFLDLKLTLTDNEIQTTVYSKPTDSHLYLQADFCHHLPSILGIQKGVALRLRRICSTDKEYNNKSKEYKAYLIGRGHKLKNIENSFNDVLNMSRQQSRIKKTKNTNSKNKIAFCSKYNPLGPNIKNIIQKHAHILDNCQIMQNKEIMVAYKREKNLKELLTRVDPYDIINNVDDEMHTYVPCKKRCDSCTNFVVAKSSFERFATK